MKVSPVAAAAAGAEAAVEEVEVVVDSVGAEGVAAECAAAAGGAGSAVERRAVGFPAAAGRRHDRVEEVSAAADAWAAVEDAREEASRGGGVPTSALVRGRRLGPEVPDRESVVVELAQGELAPEDLVRESVRVSCRLGAPEGRVRVLAPVARGPVQEQDSPIVLAVALGLVRVQALCRDSAVARDWAAETAARIWRETVAIAPPICRTAWLTPTAGT